MNSVGTRFTASELLIRELLDAVERVPTSNWFVVPMRFTKKCGLPMKVPAASHASKTFNAQRSTFNLQQAGKFDVERLALNVERLALLFSALFTKGFGRCCSPRNPVSPVNPVKTSH